MGTDDNTSAFAALLRQLRRSAGLTQEELAAKSGVGVRTVRDLERGRAARPQRATVDLLAAALDLAGTRRDLFVAAARAGRAGAWTAPPADEPAVESAARAWAAGAWSDGSEPLPWVQPLPLPTDLIGRTEDLADLADLLLTADLVTLAGVAGVGKTSLAVAVAHRVADRYPGGVGGVTLSDDYTEADVLSLVAAVFGVARAEGLPDRMREGAALLIVDAVERSPQAAADAVRWLRGLGTDLRILATGRHPLGLPGEHEWPAEPLDVPPPGVTEIAELSRYPAVQLFLARLRRVRRQRLTPREAPALGTLVRRLGGLPYALELAAARGRVLAVDEILRRYGDRPLDLDGPTGPAGEPRSLRDAVAASYRLLDPVGRRTLRWLSVLAGRWSLPIAEALLADPEAVPTDPVGAIDRLAALGLISVRGGGEYRFRLLDVVRDFAAERRDDSGERDRVHHRHLRVMADLAARAAPDLVGPRQPQAIGRLDEVAGDLRTALRTAFAADLPTGLRLAAALPRYWRYRGHDREGRAWLQQLLADPRTETVDPKVRAFAALGVAQLAQEHGEGVAELATAEAALASFQSLGHAGGQLQAHSLLCALWQAAGGYDHARRHAEAVLTLATSVGRTREIAVAHNNLTWHDIRRGDLTAARRRLRTAERLARECGDDRLRTAFVGNLAELDRLDGRYATAAATGHRAATAAAEPGHRIRILATVAMALAQEGRVAEVPAVVAEMGADPPAGIAAMIAAYVALADGDRPAAAGHFTTAARALAGRYDARDVVEALVGLAASTDDPARRTQVRADLTEACRRGQITLLPRERTLLADQ